MPSSRKPPWTIESTLYKATADLGQAAYFPLANVAAVELDPRGMAAV